eukprot:8155437-Pyramimonas_sp.AAC.1
MCRCGCNGWCSVFSFLTYIAWVIDALVKGCVPDRKWDGTEWGDGEDRGEIDGTRDFGFRCMLLYLKGDWSEFAKTFGLGSWGRLMNPCPLCFTDKANMHEGYGSMCTDCLLFQNKTALDYERSCQKCEKRVSIDSEERRLRVVRALVYYKSKRGKGNHGRALKHDLVDLGLQNGDRLEPHQGMVNIRNIDCEGWRGTALFWRVHKDETGRVIDAVTHRCPLFKQEWGASPATSMAVDSLHTVYYGPITRWASSGLWRLIKLNPWNYTGDKDTVYTKCCHRLEADMFT